MGIQHPWVRKDGEWPRGVLSKRMPGGGLVLCFWILLGHSPMGSRENKKYAYDHEHVQRRKILD